MRFGVLGTGVVGKMIAAKLVEVGHQVMIGSRDPGVTRSRTDTDVTGAVFSDWQRDHPAVQLGTFQEAASFGEIVINATNGNASLEVLTRVGAAKLNGKILVDISNPLDFSKGRPPGLFVSNTDSLAEQIQREFPQSRVVKTLNTVNAFLMIDPVRLAGGDHSIFLSGNEPAAKAAVADLLRSFGWRDIVDLGDISTARGQEMYLPLWLRLWGVAKGPMFNVKLVR